MNLGGTIVALTGLIIANVVRSDQIRDILGGRDSF